MAKKSAGKKKKAVKPRKPKPPYGVRSDYRPFAPAKKKR